MSAHPEGVTIEYCKGRKQSVDPKVWRSWQMLSATGELICAGTRDYVVDYARTKGLAYRVFELRRDGRKDMVESWSPELLVLDNTMPAKERHLAEIEQLKLTKPPGWRSACRELLRLVVKAEAVHGIEVHGVSEAAGRKYRPVRIRPF